MNETCQKLYDVMKDLDQFDPDSLLVKSIMNVCDCDQKEALSYSNSHCNMISTYGILFALDYISMSYEDFLKFCLTTEFITDKAKTICNKHGYLYATKVQLFKLLGISAKMIETTSLPADRKPGDLYQVPINSKHHYIACGVGSDKTVLTFDTHAGYRGPFGSPMIHAFKYHNDKPDCFKHIF